MKLVNYTCDKCGHNMEELYYDSEEKPTILMTCPKCKEGSMLMNNRKNNSHRIAIFDRGGI